MSKFLLISLSLFALGIATVLFEGLIANNHANFHPCGSGMICDFIIIQDEISIGIFLVIAGGIMLGIRKAMKRKKIISLVGT